MDVFFAQPAEVFGSLGGNVFRIRCGVRAKLQESAEGFAPEDLLMEDASEVGGDHVGDFVEGGQGAG